MRKATSKVRVIKDRLSILEGITRPEQTEGKYLKIGGVKYFITPSIEQRAIEQLSEAQLVLMIDYVNEVMKKGEDPAGNYWGYCEVVNQYFLFWSA